MSGLLGDLPLRWCGYCDSWNSEPCGERCHWLPTDPTLEQMKARSSGKQTDLATAITNILSNADTEGKSDLESITLTLYVGEIREVLKVARGGGCG